MKITESDITIGELINRLNATGKSLETKARAFIIIEDEIAQTRENIRQAIEDFRREFVDIPPEEIEQIIAESRREVRAQKA
ncbi:MAG: hypothetical protein GKR89_17640 [Candidatus Latescibacteria bacterium]|nr:hypothetical protein [Candidatus Latescibacterota bacterium]